MNKVYKSFDLQILRMHIYTCTYVVCTVYSRLLVGYSSASCVTLSGHGVVIVRQNVDEMSMYCHNIYLGVIFVSCLIDTQDMDP